MVQFSVVTNMVITFSVVTIGSSAPQTLLNRFSTTAAVRTLAEQVPVALAEQKNREILVNSDGSSLADKERTAKALIEGGMKAAILCATGLVGRVQEDLMFGGVKYAVSATTKSVAQRVAQFSSRSRWKRKVTFDGDLDGIR
jgi:hypothetical protein